jgi:choline dehydrogenase-like flavoprotein
VSDLEAGDMITGRFQHGDDVTRLERAAVNFLAAEEATSFRTVAMPDPATRPYVRDVRRRLSHLLRPAGLHIIPGATTIAPPGRGIHIGATFPMRSRVRAELETDTLGRPYGWRRIHVVDAACLPSLAGTTLTLTIMANAHSIATAAEVSD